MTTSIIPKTYLRIFYHLDTIGVSDSKPMTVLRRTRHENSFINTWQKFLNNNSNHAEFNLIQIFIFCSSLITCTAFINSLYFKRKIFFSDQSTTPPRIQFYYIQSMQGESVEKTWYHINHKLENAYQAHILKNLFTIIPNNTYIQVVLKPLYGEFYMRVIQKAYPHYHHKNYWENVTYIDLIMNKTHCFLSNNKLLTHYYNLKKQYRKINQSNNLKEHVSIIPTGFSNQKWLTGA